MAEALSRLHSEIFASTWTTETVEHQLSRDNFLGFAAQCIEKRVLVGYISVQRVAEIAEIMSFCVRADYRHRGIGNKLMISSLHELVQLKVEDLFLEVAESNKRAVYLYSHFGFEIVGQRKNYYRIRDAAPNNTLEDAYVMRKKLEDDMVKMVM